ncbi:hypothetical protein V6N12_044444 [Hibiscus sabdariffa]|uniref:Glycine-rich protein n=1 Tax=Hibiscus sabdariffa TaxID=183260 RepID=A0ABR2BNB3_9ROSI
MLIRVVCGILVGWGYELVCGSGLDGNGGGLKGRLLWCFGRGVVSEKMVSKGEGYGGKGARMVEGSVNGDFGELSMGKLLRVEGLGIGFGKGAGEELD